MVTRTLLAILVALSASLSSAIEPPLTKADPASPLATDGQWLYAVADQGQSIIYRPLPAGEPPFTDASWRPLSGPKFGRIIGIAGAPNALFVADGATNSLIRLQPGSSHRETISATGTVLAGVAFAGALFVVDGASGEIVRYAAGAEFSRLKLKSFHGPTKTHISSDGRSLVIAHPEIGDIHHVPNPGSANPSARVIYHPATAGQVRST